MAAIDADEKQLQEVTNLGKKKAKIIQKVFRESYDDKKTFYLEEGSEEKEEIEEAFEIENKKTDDN